MWDRASLAVGYLNKDPPPDTYLDEVMVYLLGTPIQEPATKVRGETLDAISIFIDDQVADTTPKIVSRKLQQ